MSWFSFSNNKKEMSPSKKEMIHNSEDIRNGRLWIQTASTFVYEETVANFLEEFKALEVGFTHVASRYPASLIYTTLLLKKMLKIDRTRLSPEEQNTLGRLVFSVIPSHLNKLETRLYHIDPSIAVDRYDQEIKHLVQNVVDPLPMKIPLPKATAESKEVTRKAVETIGSKESDAKLKLVQRLASEACEVAQSMEDQFFADQALNSYIPDSIRIFTGLINAPEDMKVEANKLFIRQMEVLEKQLNAIIRRNSLGTLAQMQAHTEFLESKNEGLEITLTNER